MDLETVRRRAVSLLPFFVGVLCFIYRFNKLGDGGLAGFTNDQFGYLTRARQMLAGELPFRDFNNPGWFLADVASAAAQYIGGYNLLSEAILTTAMLAVGAMATYTLSYRVSGSVTAALLAALFHIAIEPRHYNYPKITFYALTILAAWRYVDRPTGGRLTLLGALVAVAALFRHDHAIYLGGFAMLTAILVHRDDSRVLFGRLTHLAAVSLVIVAPFLAFVQFTVGVPEYYRTTMVYANRDFARANFELPRFEARRAEVAAKQIIRINVRWVPAAGEAERQAGEKRYLLAAGEDRGEGTWNYELLDTSRQTVERLVKDPLVADTHGIDRTSFEVPSLPVEEPASWLASLRGVTNATAWLYYVQVLLPVVVALALGAIRVKVGRGVTERATVLTDPACLLPLLALAIAINYSFMSRGSTSIRVPDVAVTSAVLGAWLVATTLGPTAGRLIQRPGLKTAVRMAAVVVLLVTVTAVDGLANTRQSIEASRLSSGPLATAERTAAVWRTLGATPPLASFPTLMPGIVRMARYINACTRADDRLFLFGELPELYYLSGRLMGGGHPWLMPGYYSDDVDERLTLERLRHVRVPIVVTPVRSVYDAEYRPQFDLIDAYLTANFVDAGDVDLEDDPQLRVLFRRDLEPSGTYAPLGLPCFAAEPQQHAANATTDR